MQLEESALNISRPVVEVAADTSAAISAEDPLELGCTYAYFTGSDGRLSSSLELPEIGQIALRFGAVSIAKRP